MSGPDLSQLVRQAGEGDPAAWNTLVERYAGLVWSVARAHRLDTADAADVSQVTWMRLVEGLGKLREPDALPGWLATTARRECLALLRRKGRHMPADIDLTVQPAPDETAPPLDAQLLRGERAEAVRQAFADLPPRCQVLLRLLMADPPANYAKVCESLGMPHGSLGPTRKRCLDLLRRHPQLGSIRSG